MSRDIDFSQPLSEEDAAYVADRPWLAEDARLRGLEIEVDDTFVVDTDETEESDDSEEGSDEVEDDEEEDLDDETEESDDYSTWSVARLKDELERAGLSRSGSKEQLIERLQSNN